MTQFIVQSSDNQFRRTVIDRLGPGEAALATDATTGFLYVPTCAGTPTGIPEPQTGMIPVVYDKTNNLLYAYSNGAWRT